MTREELLTELAELAGSATQRAGPLRSGLEELHGLLDDYWFDRKSFPATNTALLSVLSDLTRKMDHLREGWDYNQATAQGVYEKTGGMARISDSLPQVFNVAKLHKMGKDREPWWHKEAITLPSVHEMISYLDMRWKELEQETDPTRLRALQELPPSFPSGNNPTPFSEIGFRTRYGYADTGIGTALI